MASVGSKTPAMDATYIFTITAGSSLDVFTVADGKLAYTIADPAAVTPVRVTGEYNAAPIVGAQHEILACTGVNDSASATPATEGRNDRPRLVQFRPGPWPQGELADVGAVLYDDTRHWRTA